MIIAKHSGNVIGYLDYYNRACKRITGVTAVARVQKVRLGESWHTSSASRSFYLDREKEKLGTGDNIGRLIELFPVSGTLFIYNSKGICKSVCEAGNILNITI